MFVEGSHTFAMFALALNGKRGIPVKNTHILLLYIMHVLAAYLI